MREESLLIFEFKDKDFKKLKMNIFLENESEDIERIGFVRKTDRH